MLRLLYVCYFLTTGVSVPFFPAYLRALGLSGRDVGVLLAVPPALQLCVPLAWGWIADRTRRPDRVLRVLCLGAFVASLPIIFLRTLPALAAVYVAQNVFSVAIVALTDGIAVERSRQGSAYGPTRAAGSASFIGICLLAGFWLDLRHVPGGDRLVPILISVGFGLSFLATLGLHGHRASERPHVRDVRLLLGDRRFRLLLVMAGLHWAALVPYHGFFGILLHDRGLAARTTSYAFIVGTTAEIAVFLRFARLRARFALTHLLAAAFAASALRWCLSAYAHAAWAMVALQASHGLTFGLFWATAMAWLADTVPASLRATGQVLFSTATGVGSLIALLLAGALYDFTGGAGTAFALAGALELVPLVLVLAAARKQGAALAAQPDRATLPGPSA
jgi:MFS transporter, PPP family, 3-phenylpropionic acid transporter